MSNDVMFVIGAILLVLAIPSVINAFSESRFPRMAVVLFVVGAGMVSWASYSHPGGYTFQEVPHIFVRVFAQMVR